MINRNALTRGPQLFVLALTCSYLAICAFQITLREPQPAEQYYVITLFLCVFAILAFVTNRVIFASFVSGSLFWGLEALSNMKMQYLHWPLMPADFIYFTRESLLQTLSQYPNLIELTAAIFIVAPVLFWLTWHFNTVRAVPTAYRRYSLPIRTIGLTASLLALWWCLQPTGPFASVYKGGVWDNLVKKGPLTTLFVNLRNLNPELPLTDKSVPNSVDWQTQPVVATTESAHIRPDIIQILEESTANPLIYQACSVPQCQVSLFEPDQYTRTHGLLQVHTYGGGTWMSEFAAISGMPHNIFGNSGAYAPFVLAPRLQDSLPRQLKRLGYLTIAIYPTDANFVNARNAYKAYGFDLSYDARSLGIPLSWHIPDEELFAAAKRIYNEHKSPDQPIFLFILTIAQHGPHNNQPIAQLQPPFNRELFPSLPRPEETALTTYLSRLRDSSTAMESLEHYFLRRSEPTIVTHFGDHQANLGKLTYEVPPTPDQKDSELTYFMLKSNFKGPTIQPYNVTDIAYLPSIILSASGLPKDTYFTALSNLERYCDGKYTACNNKELLQSYYHLIFNKLHVFR